MARPPFEPATIALYPTRQSWDSASADLLQTMLNRWSLTPGVVFAGGFSGVVMTVTDGDGFPAVLKVLFPHREAMTEAVAMEAFPPGTAPSILRVDPWAWAMLLERVVPGTTLAHYPLPVDEALHEGAVLLARLHTAPIPSAVPALATTVLGFVARARSHTCALHHLGIGEFVAAVFDGVVRLVGEDSAPAVLLHGDFNPGNILRAEGSWVAIDPKPMAGDGAWDLWPIVSQLGPVAVETRNPIELERRMRFAASRAGVDPVRAIRWARVRAALTICWYLDGGDVRRAEAEIPNLVAWHSVCRLLDDGDL